MPHHIIVGDNGAAGGADALALGLALADAAPDVASVVVVSVVLGGPRNRANAGAPEAGFTDEHLRRARIMCDDRSDVSFRTVVGVGPGHALQRVAREVGAEIIVIGRGHRGPVGRLIGGSATERTLRDAPCAVAIAPPGLARDPCRIRRVAAAYDGTFDANRALRAAAAIARSSGARLSAVHVEECWGPTTDDPRTRHDAVLADSDEVLSHQERLPIDLRTRFSRGLAGAELAQDDAFDLLVVGSRGVGALERAFRGSTSLHLARHARTSVLVVPRTPQPDVVAAPPTATPDRRTTV